MVTMEANLQEMEEKVLAPRVTERDRQMAQRAVPKQGKKQGQGQEEQEQHTKGDVSRAKNSQSHVS